MRISGLASAWLMSIALTSKAAAGSAAKGPPNPIETATRVLPNGLRIVAIRDHRAPLVAIDVRYDTGEAADPPELPGLARGIGDVLDGSYARATGGSKDLVNGWALNRAVTVTADETHVMSVVPLNALDFSLWLEARRMVLQANAIDKHSANGAAYALQPWSTSVGANTPNNGIGNILQRAVFGPAHPYFVQAPADTSDKLTTALLRDRLRDWYTPTSATVTIVGDVSALDAVRNAEKYFDRIAGRSIAGIPTAPPAQWARDISVMAAVEEPVVATGWVTAPFLADDNLALDLAAKLVERDLRTRLVDTGNASRIEVAQRSRRLGSTFMIAAEVSNERWKARVVDAVSEELERLKTDPIGQSDLDFARQARLVDIALNSDGLLEEARLESTLFAVTGVAGYSTTLFSRYRALVPGDISAAVRRNLTAERRVLAYVTPKADVADGVVVLNEPRRTFRAASPATNRQSADGAGWDHPPPVSGKHGFDPATASEGTTEGGIRVLTIANSDVPLVRFRVFAPWLVPSPSVEAIRTAPDALAITLIGGRTLESRLDALGVKSRFAADVNGVSIRGAAMPDGVEGAIRTIFSALRTRVVRKETSEQLRRRLAFRESRSDESPNPFWRLEDDRYGLDGQPDPESFDGHSDAAFVRRSLERLARNAWKPPFSVSLVGSISAEEALALVARADSKAEPHADRRTPPLARASEKFGGIDLVENERSGKSSLVFSCSVPDSQAVLSEPMLKLPGFFSRELSAWGRATDVIRNGADWIFYLDVVAGAHDAAGIVREVLRRAESLSKGDFSESRAWYRPPRALSLATEGSDSTFGVLAQLYELGPDASRFSYVFHQPGDFDSVSVQTVARMCFSPESLHVVGYGQVRDVAAELETHGYGPARVSTVDQPWGTPIRSSALARLAHVR